MEAVHLSRDSITYSVSLLFFVKEQEQDTLPETRMLKRIINDRDVPVHCSRYYRRVSPPLLQFPPPTGSVRRPRVTSFRTLWCNDKVKWIDAKTQTDCYYKQRHIRVIMSPCSAAQLQYQVLLAAAAQDGALAEVKYLINNERVDVNGEDVFDEAPLHWASSCGDESVVKFLLENGAEVNRPHLKTRETPLHWACAAGSVKAVRLLFQYGADGKRLDKNRRTPLQSAIQKSQWPVAQYFIEEQPRILCSCPELCLRISQAGQISLLKEFLKRETADTLAFCWAIRHQAIELVTTFLRSNASLLHRDPRIGETALTMACRQRFPDALYVMLRSRPDVWSDAATLLADP